MQEVIEVGDLCICKDGRLCTVLAVLPESLYRYVFTYNDDTAQILQYAYEYELVKVGVQCKQ